ncbi:DUF58 domain-containing protein, partial [Georgenia sp. 10Sc9-8]|nr:DUF58 domain-containing protein [Georgenia halotolerans]
LGRPDVTVVGAPLLLHAAWGRLAGPSEAWRLAVRAGDQTEAGALVASAVLTVPPGTELVRVRASSPGSRPHEALVRVPGERAVGLRTRTVRTGEHELFRVDALPVGAEWSSISRPVTVGPVPVLVLPRALPLPVVPLPPRLQGLTGAHSAGRPGEGGDFHDVHPFVPGDRLRRVDWRTTGRRAARTGGRTLELYVRRTRATADATVMLVMDSRDDVGPDVATWAGAGSVRSDEPTSLDLARQAAASLARGYLDGGDRVGLEDLGRRRRPVRPAAGSRHLERVVRRLALSRAERQPGPRHRAPQIPSGALVVVLSTFLDGEAARMAHLWRRAGHRVLAVDVLPEVREGDLDARLRTAYRLVRMEREDRLT